MSNRIVAHFNNGILLKGQTWDFAPFRDVFHLTLITGARQIPVTLEDLKAIFFVRDFEGNQNYERKWNSDSNNGHLGKKIIVTFDDGEILVGTSQSYHPQGTGFFFYPADPESNNLRIFIINSSVNSIEEID